MRDIIPSLTLPHRGRRDSDCLAPELWEKNSSRGEGDTPEADSKREITRPRFLVLSSNRPATQVRIDSKSD